MPRGARVLIATLSLVATVLVSGCDETKRLTLRKPGGGAASADVVRDDPSFARPAEANGFFKSRKPATWSSEARDIEKSLGVEG